MLHVCNQGKIGITVGTLPLLMLFLPLPALRQHRPTGFVGTYHTAGGQVHDGRNSSAFDVGAWGIVASTNSPSDGGMSFRDGLRFHCKEHDINQLFGMLIAHSEGGIFNNTNDTDPWKPLQTCEEREGKQCDSRGPAGMLQGAARWSYLARTYCPQISGVVIDDFFSNYVDTNVPEPGPHCPSCPISHPHGYGSSAAGYFCCAWPLDSTGHCTKPSTSPPSPPGFSGGCCLWPGERKGCQMDPKCPNNPTNATPCELAHSTLGLDQMKDLQAAIQGKAVLPDGSIDHDSPALTPHLKIFVVTYEEDQQKVTKQHPLISHGIVGGLSYWISGASQKTISKDLTSMVQGLRAQLPINFPILTGGYLIHSRIGWLPPSSFYDMLSQSIELYDSAEIEGFFVFSGSALQTMNTSEWELYNIPEHLEKLYFPWMGSATVSVREAGRKDRPISDAIVTVKYNGTTAVTRKKAGTSGISFGGWVGKHSPVVHTISVTAAGYKNISTQVQLKAQQTVSVVVDMKSA